MAAPLPSIVMVPPVCSADELAGILRVRPSIVPELDRMGVIVRAGEPGRYCARESHALFTEALTSVVGWREAAILRDALAKTVQFIGDDVPLAEVANAR
jgi:hypothetical protein